MTYVIDPVLINTDSVISRTVRLPLWYNASSTVKSEIRIPYLLMSSLICSSIVLDAFIRMTNDFNDKFSAIRFTPISCNKLPLKQVFLIKTNYTALCRSEQIIGLESFPFHKPWVIVVSEVRGICHQGDVN